MLAPLGTWTLVTRPRRTPAAIHQGSAILSRLEGEWWLRFRADETNESSFTGPTKYSRHALTTIVDSTDRGLSVAMDPTRTHPSADSGHSPHRSAKGKGRMSSWCADLSTLRTSPAGGTSGSRP